jgi:uridine phosphorylase
MALAQLLTEQPKMSNHARGLWGYSGRTPDGQGLTVQSTGMGGPSAALVLGDLAELGVRRAVRVGTCAALGTDPGTEDLVGGTRRLRPGDLVEVKEAQPWSIDHRGASVFPDEKLSTRLRSALGDAARSGKVASLDVPHPFPGRPSPDGDAADMQTAALFGAGRGLGVALAAVLVVTEAEGADPLSDEALADRAAFAAEVSLRALFP